MSDIDSLDIDIEQSEDFEGPHDQKSLDFYNNTSDIDLNQIDLSC